MTEKKYELPLAGKVVAKVEVDGEPSDRYHFDIKITFPDGDSLHIYEDGQAGWLDYNLTHNPQPKEVPKPMDLGLLYDQDTEAMPGAGVNLVRLNQWVVGLSQGDFDSGEALYPVSDPNKPICIGVYPNKPDLSDEAFLTWGYDIDYLSTLQAEVWVRNLKAAQEFISWLNQQTCPINIWDELPKAGAEPTGALMPDGTRLNHWDERLRTTGGVPTYD